MVTSIFGLPPWVGALILSLILTYAIVLGGWTLAKAGRSPLWVLLLLLPYVNVVAVWAFAYARWPFVDGAKTVADAGQDMD